MKRNCRFFVFLMIIGMMIFSVSSKAYAVDIDVLGAPEGSVTLVINLYLSQEIAKTDSGLRLNAMATEGFLYNLTEMGRKPERWKNSIFGTDDVLLTFAHKGGKEPFKKFIPEPINAKFKFIFGTGWIATGNFFITLDPKLKSFSDLKGKKIGLGLLTQGSWSMNPLLNLQYGYGITDENSKILNIAPSKLAKSLLNGETDAIVAGLATDPTGMEWSPTMMFSELIQSGKNLYYIGQNASIADKLNEQLKTSYLPVDIPVGKLPGQTEVIHTFVVRNYWACHESFSEELAYKLVKYLAKVGPKAKLEAGIWQTWSPEMMIAGLSEENTHPGAILAYKELGWWEFTKKFKPVNLPK